ncbi:chemotaxis protein CheW [Desulfovibrio ferrophilus]|uniref:Chemotaxis protein CheW n=1 Tax=Desulfovibrio ferrophilus TaxID=241368 RepID=A0A2Z6B3M3_9BACT|nr:chemotaxis protein CheW [Desulfovibrio ferrophilus]BBD10026.1 chemotaxis protein CheW [Desulfovibrio ferrophilus]
MSNPQTDETNQYLTFSLDKEIFALDITQVREVLEVASVTRIPRTPPFMRGVINLRGHAVPVVDMRCKFGMPSMDDTVDTCIVITEVDLGGESAVLGALVDSVREVFEMMPESIEPAPRMGTSIRTDFIRGMGKQNDQFVIILDINRIFSSEELAVLATAEDLDSQTEATAEAI